MATNYLLHAINLYDTINIKSVRNVLTGKVVDSSPQEIHFQYGENCYISVYRFGCIVFFNMPGDQVEKETAKLKGALGPGSAFPTSETYQVTVGDVPTRVEFEFVELKKMTLDQMRVLAITVAQSAALESFEIQVERMLYGTSKFMENLSENGSVPFFPKKLLKLVGSTASTRQNIISNVAVLDPPEGTWKSKELEKLYREVQENFDIDVRFKTLDRKLSLIQNNLEILADITVSRRATILEAMIVLLIVFEIVMKFFE